MCAGRSGVGDRCYGVAGPTCGEDGASVAGRDDISKVVIDVRGCREAPLPQLMAGVQVVCGDACVGGARRYLDEVTDDEDPLSRYGEVFSRRVLKTVAYPELGPGRRVHPDDS